MPESEPTNQTSADACTRYEANEKLNGHINAASSHLAQSQAPIFPPAKPHPQVTNLSSAQESLPKFSDYLMSVSLASGIVALAAVLLRLPLHTAATSSDYYKGSSYFAPDFISTILAICGSIASIFFSIALIIYAIYTSIRTPSNLKKKLPRIIGRIMLNLLVIMLFTVTFLLQ